MYICLLFRSKLSVHSFLMLIHVSTVSFKHKIRKFRGFFLFFDAAMQTTLKIQQFMNTARGPKQYLAL